MPVDSSSKILEFLSAFQVLLTALRFNNKAVAQIASDMLLLLADHVKNFLDYYPEVPKKIIEVLARFEIIFFVFFFKDFCVKDILYS